MIAYHRVFGGSTCFSAESKEMFDPECPPQSKLINNHSAGAVSMCDISLLLLVTRLMNLASCGCGVIRSTNSHKHILGAFKT